VVGVVGKVIGRRAVVEVGVGDHAHALERLEVTIDGGQGKGRPAVSTHGRGKTVRRGMAEGTDRGDDPLPLRGQPHTPGPQGFAKIPHTASLLTSRHGIERNTLRALRSVVGTLGEVLITLGLLLLLFVSWQLWWTDVSADREQAGTVQSLERDFAPRDLTPHDQPGRTESLATLKKVPFGEAFAIVRIPRFGAGYARPVLEGDDRDTLIRGLGHYPGTALPGQVGNFAVAGHRTTYGRPLHNVDLLQKGDFIVVETKAGYLVYAVDRHVIVTPRQVEVIAPVPQQPGAQPTQAWMTMTTCEPKFSARQRWVVFARLVKSIPRAKGLPASFMVVPAGAA
jgi:sortase A